MSSPNRPKSLSVKPIHAQYSEIPRGPGRPRLADKPGKTRVPTLRHLGVSRAWLAGLAEHLARDTTPASKRFARDVAQLIERADTHAAKLAASRRPGTGRPSAYAFRVTLASLDRPPSVRTVATIGEAAELVGLTRATLAHYLSTPIGGAIGQWSRGNAMVQRVPRAGTEHACGT